MTGGLFPQMDPDSVRRIQAGEGPFDPPPETEEEMTLGRARRLVVELRTALGQAHPRSPLWPPGQGPSHADNLADVLNLIDFSLRQIEVYLGAQP